MSGSSIRHHAVPLYKYFPKNQKIPENTRSLKPFSAIIQSSRGITSTNPKIFFHGLLFSYARTRFSTKQRKQVETLALCKYEKLIDRSLPVTRTTYHKMQNYLTKNILVVKRFECITPGIDSSPSQ